MGWPRALELTTPTNATKTSLWVVLIRYFIFISKEGTDVFA